MTSTSNRRWVVTSQHNSCISCVTKFGKRPMKLLILIFQKCSEICWLNRVCGKCLSLSINNGGDGHLFLVFVCSILGYTQFLKLSWLENILSWQNRIGCFLEPNILTDNRRVKRSDNVVLMGDEKCSVHFTTVSLCAMAMHLRYFGDTCLKNY